MTSFHSFGTCYVSWFIVRGSPLLVGEEEENGDKLQMKVYKT